MKKLFLIGVAAIAIGAKSPKPLPTAQPISASDRSLGAKAHQDILQEFGGIYVSRQADYVTRVGRRVAVQSGLSNAENDFTITLLNSPVNNAFAIPGGYVYVTRQLLALMNSEAELASVLGHEVGHVAARHSNRRQSKARLGSIGAVLATVIGSAVAGDTGAKIGQQIGGTLAQSYVLSFSRSQEYEADDLGVSYLARTGYDPFAASSMLASLAAQTSLDARAQGQSGQKLPSWQSTHPDPASRVTRAASRAQSLTARGNERSRDQFLAAIDGMIYGDDPKQGIVDGSVFSHPDMRLTFRAPRGFVMANGSAAVTITGAGGSAEFSALPYGGNLSQYVGEVFRAYGTRQKVTLEPGRVSLETANGLPVAVASAVVNAQSGTLRVTVVAYEFGQDRAYHFVTITPADTNPFGTMFDSLRRLSAQEAAAIKPRRVTVVTVRANDTIATMADRMAFGDLRLERFLVLNALRPNSTLTPGQKVKLITY